MGDRIAKIGKLLVKMDLAETEAVMDTLIKYRDELLTVEDQLNLLDKSDKSEAELEQAIDSLSEDIKLAKSEYLATLKSFRFCPLCLSEIDESTVEGLALEKDSRG